VDLVALHACRAVIKGTHAVHPAQALLARHRRRQVEQAKTGRRARAAFDALSARMAPGATDSAEYRAQLKTIIDEMQSEFRRAADVHVAEAKSTLSALIYDVTQNVKPGSENAVEIIKAAIDNAFKGYEQVTQATRQAVQNVEEQIAKASSLVNPGMGKAAAPEDKPAE